MNARTLALAGAGATILVAVTAFAAQQDMHTPPPAAKEHQWLKQLAGEWTTQMEANMPGQPPMKQEGTESVQMIGEYWAVSTVKGSMMGMPFTGHLTIGYDPEDKEFVGTWIDSMSTHMWEYEGQLDATGKILTLETEGPGPTGKPTKFKESIEIKSKDEKSFTSMMQDEKGAWVTAMKASYKRKM